MIQKRVAFVSFTICILILSFPLSTCAQTTAFGPSLETLDEKILTQMEEGGIPSLQACIIVNDSLVWAKGYGDQPELDTVYSIASISKTFTGTAYLQLHEQGLVDLDEDVSSYLPFDVRNPNDPDTVITSQLLLSHKAGMTRNYDFGIGWLDDIFPEWFSDYVGEGYNFHDGARPPLGEIINSTNVNDPDLWLPTSGSDYSYSSSGFFFLSFLLEKITNQTFYDYISENILTPLDMSDTGFLVSEFGDNLAIPHGTFDNGTITSFPHYNRYNYGGGAMKSNVQELSKYLIAHMNGGLSDGVQVLDTESVQLMHTNELGWEDEVRKGHSGGLPGFASEMRYINYESSTYGVILLANREDRFSQSTAVGSSYNRILNYLFQEVPTFINSTTTTPTSPPTTTSPDFLIVGGIAIGSVLVIAVGVLIMKKRKG